MARLCAFAIAGLLGFDSGQFCRWWGPQAEKVSAPEISNEKQSASCTPASVSLSLGRTVCMGVLNCQNKARLTCNMARKERLGESCVHVDRKRVEGEMSEWEVAACKLLHLDTVNKQ